MYATDTNATMRLPTRGERDADRVNDFVRTLNRSMLTDDAFATIVAAYIASWRGEVLQ